MPSDDSQPRSEMGKAAAAIAELQGELERLREMNTLQNDVIKTFMATYPPGTPTATASAEEENEDDRDYEAMARLPAVYADTWYVITWKGHLRMTLGEDFEKPHYRAAFVLELDDAERLAKHILRSVERRRKRDTASEVKNGSVSKSDA